MPRLLPLEEQVVERPHHAVREPLQHVPPDPRHLVRLRQPLLPRWPLLPLLEQPLETREEKEEPAKRP